MSLRRRVPNAGYKTSEMKDKSRMPLKRDSFYSPNPWRIPATFVVVVGNGRGTEIGRQEEEVEREERILAALFEALFYISIPIRRYLVFASASFPSLVVIVVVVAVTGGSTIKYLLW